MSNKKHLIFLIQNGFFLPLDQHFKMYPKLADNLDFVDELDFSLLTCRFRSIPIDFFEKVSLLNVK